MSLQFSMLYTYSNFGVYLLLFTDFSAQANARKYFSQKKQAASKEIKTIQSGTVALKSAEKKTKQSLKVFHY